ncbi:MAG: C1 family peptidase [Muribaculaceae bacterium]|nr:C1 family peptidase [Muribaculaceae bacterium]
MQHIVHIFVGDELISFRDQFSSIFREFNPDVSTPFFTVLSAKADKDGSIYIFSDGIGEGPDGGNFYPSDNQHGLRNFFESLYSRKVTVAHPGNRSMVIVIWVQLFVDHTTLLRQLIETISNCTSKISIEISGFTNDAVSTFIPEHNQRLAPSVYRETFNLNLKLLKQLRSRLTALRLIANRNAENVSLDFDEDIMARVCAEYATLQCKHYSAIHRQIIDDRLLPCESFGLSSIKFDRKYYYNYIRNRIIIDKIRQQNIDGENFNINAIAQKTNPILNNTLDQIRSFYSVQAANAKARLALNGDNNASNVVGEIDHDLSGIVNGLQQNIERLLNNEEITIFEREALLSLILGDDCSLFDTSAVAAHELIIDDILDESADFFVNLDNGAVGLHKVKQSTINEIRTKMRNIAVANRQREDRISAIRSAKPLVNENQEHITDKGYHFGSNDYKINLCVDSEPLETTYEPHRVTSDNVDLRYMFRSVRDQGEQGSCSAFAVASVIEAMKSGRKRLSPAYIYWNARKKNNVTGIDSGASLFDILKSVMTEGICDEELMPYQSDCFAVAPSPSANAQASECKIIEAKNVEIKLHDIKSALSDGHPVIIAAEIFESFSDTTGGFLSNPSFGEVRLDKANDKHGVHAMVVCGFSDRERVLIVRNSWGKTFGDEGYCYMPYSYAKKYIRQACIITKISSDNQENGKRQPIKQTLNFNLSDSNIEAAILKNLIEEDNDKLSDLEKESNRLKIEWTQNVGILGNVNNQKIIVEGAQNAIGNEIQKERELIDELQSSKGKKLREFAKTYAKVTVLAFFFTFIWWIIFYLTPSSVVFSVSSVITLIFIILIARYTWEYKLYRQKLIDEIQQHSRRVDILVEERDCLDIKAHIHGRIIKEISDYKLLLRNKCKKITAFNSEIKNCYRQYCENLKAMNPDVPYPFLTVLTNRLLSRYYEHWKHKMIASFDIFSLLEQYTPDENIYEIIEHQQELKTGIYRGLKSFSMSEYVVRTNLNKWQFLPDDTGMAVVFPELDSRAVPFCPYDSQFDYTEEKYIFIQGVSPSKSTSINPYFQRPPMLIASDDTDTISLLTVIRFALDSGEVPS